MRHQKAKDLLASLALNELSSSEQSAVEQHVASCSACQAELDEMRQTFSLLEDAVGALPTRTLSAERVDTVLAAASDESLIEKMDAPTRPSAPKRTPKLWLVLRSVPVQRWAAVAAVFAVVGIIVMMSLLPQLGSDHVASMTLYSRTRPRSPAPVAAEYAVDEDEYDTEDATVARDPDSNHTKFGNVVFGDGYVKGFAGRRWSARSDSASAVANRSEALPTEQLAFQQAAPELGRRAAGSAGRRMGKGTGGGGMGMGMGGGGGMGMGLGVGGGMEGGGGMGGGNDVYFDRGTGKFAKKQTVKADDTFAAGEALARGRKDVGDRTLISRFRFGNGAASAEITTEGEGKPATGRAWYRRSDSARGGAERLPGEEPAVVAGKPLRPTKPSRRRPALTSDFLSIADAKPASGAAVVTDDTSAPAAPRGPAAPPSLTVAAPTPAPPTEPAPPPAPTRLAPKKAPLPAITTPLNLMARTDPRPGGSTTVTSGIEMRRQEVKAAEKSKGIPVMGQRLAEAEQRVIAKPKPPPAKKPAPRPRRRAAAIQWDVDELAGVATAPTNTGTRAGKDVRGLPDFRRGSNITLSKKVARPKTEALKERRAAAVSAETAPAPPATTAPAPVQIAAGTIVSLTEAEPADRSSTAPEPNLRLTQLGRNIDVTPPKLPGQVADGRKATDQDGDGLPEWWVSTYAKTNKNPQGDADGDGLTNIQEYYARTNPKVTDTDDDGIHDGDEDAAKPAARFALSNFTVEAWVKPQKAGEKAAPVMARQLDLTEGNGTIALNAELGDVQIRDLNFNGVNKAPAAVALQDAEQTVAFGTVIDLGLDVDAIGDDAVALDAVQGANVAEFTVQAGNKPLNRKEFEGKILAHIATEAKARKEKAKGRQLKEATVKEVALEEEEEVSETTAAKDVLRSQADVFKRNKRYADARDGYEKLLLKDPYDVRAIRELRAINGKLLEEANEKRARGEQVGERVAEVHWKWAEPATPLLAGPAAEVSSVTVRKADLETGIKAKLRDIILPKIEFEGEPLTSVVKTLRTRSMDLDPDGEGVPFVLLNPASATAPERTVLRGISAAEKTITMSMDNIPLGEAIRYICMGTGAKFRVDDDAVVLQPPAPPARPADPFVAAEQDMQAGNLDQAKSVLNQIIMETPSGPEASKARTLVREVYAQQFAEQAAEVADDPLPPAPRVPPPPVNPFVLTEKDHQSTFALEADTAAYTLARRYIRQGYLPPVGVVRMEEFINAFDYNYPRRAGQTFSVHSEAAPAPNGAGLVLLKIGVKGRIVGRDGRKPAHLVFAIDASGSMGREDRMPLVKYALTLLLDQLGPKDRISLIAYGTHARLLLEAVPATERKRIPAALNAIECGASTNILSGIELGYQVAARYFEPGQVNRVILCSDGVANVGPSDAETLLKRVETYRDQGISFTSVGVGAGSYDDHLLEQLANKGDGNYIFIDSKNEAKRAFAENMSATIQMIAKDVKIQVEFNEKRVRRYRLIGYENRAVADKDFRNDAVDAGEIGSGQSATALYELELIPGNQDDLGTVYVRYKDIDRGGVHEFPSRLRSGSIMDRTPERHPRFFLAACVAEFAELLRASEHAQGGALQDLEQTMIRVANALPLDERVQELLLLVQKAQGLPRAK